MPAPQHRICQLADEAAAARDPEAALRCLRELRDELVAFERARVGDALRSGASFGAIAKVMGISRQAAHRRYRDLPTAPAEPLAMSSHARRVIHIARRDAAAMGARGVTSEHLLLGVLRSGGSASRALEAGGVDTEEARKFVRADDGTTDELRREPDDGGRAVLAQAAEIARARHAQFLEAEHIALAALRDPDGGALRTITALGLTPADVRERLG